MSNLLNEKKNDEDDEQDKTIVFDHGCYDETIENNFYNEDTDETFSSESDTNIDKMISTEIAKDQPEEGIRRNAEKNEENNNQIKRVSEDQI